MGKLAAVTCETAKPDPKRDWLLGDGDGLFLRVRPHGTKTWAIEYEFQGKRTKYTIGGYSRDGAPGESISDWLRHGQQSLTQARSIAGNWKASRRGGHDPAAEWEALLSKERGIATEKQVALEAERKQPTVKEAIESFMQKIMAGKKSAPAIQYRLNRLAVIIGEHKIRDVTRQHVIAALDTIAGRANSKATDRRNIDPSQAVVAICSGTGMADGFAYREIDAGHVRRQADQARCNPAAG